MNNQAQAVKKVDNTSGDSSVITKMIMRLFEHWKLTYEQQASLLSLSTNTNSSIARYRKGQSKLSLADRDKSERVGHLLAIHKYLRMIFPRNQELAYEWPTSPNKYFDNNSPLDVILTEGFEGLIRVRRYLESYIGR